jgi:hypothetical protein
MGSNVAKKLIRAHLMDAARMGAFGGPPKPKGSLTM